MQRRTVPEINAGSMADIAFLLLIFFLVTTTMDTDIGLLKKLSQPVPEDYNPPEVRERNIFVVLVNRNDQLLVEGRLTNIQKLNELTKEFIINPLNKPDLPEKKTVYIKDLGEMNVSKGVISIKTDRGTSYKMYIAVMNELMKALNEIKDDASYKYYKKSYKGIGKERREIIDDVIPVVISEAEPNRVKQLNK